MSTHIPVLLHEIQELLECKPGEVVVDATGGGGSHAHALCDAIGSTGTLFVFDQDQEAVDRITTRLAGQACQHTVLCENFRNMHEALERQGCSAVDCVLFDLGLSSDQLDVSGRGFSFQKDEPLDMSFRQGADITAEVIVNEWAEETLADIIWGFGEERYARKIARAIIEARQEHRITRTTQLADILQKAVGRQYARKKVHPATKTFQALRIAVNDEMGALAEGLAGAYALLAPGGRIAVISFHSLEDRFVKRFFRQRADAEEGVIRTKKPIVPSEEEIIGNPRSRSAKLRVFAKHHE